MGISATRLEKEISLGKALKDLSALWNDQDPADTYKLIADLIYKTNLKFFYREGKDTWYVSAQEAAVSTQLTKAARDGMENAEVTIYHSNNETKKIPLVSVLVEKKVICDLLEKNNLQIPGSWTGIFNGGRTQNVIDDSNWGSDWRDITIILTNQGTLLLENKKTGKTENIHPSALGLCSRRVMNPNKKFKILGRMFDKEPVKVDKKTAPYISRLGKSLRSYFSIDSDPFHKNNKRYYPVFNIESQQKNQDKRLVKASAISKKTKSFDQMTDPEIARLVKESEEDEKSTYYTTTKRRP